MDRVEWNRAADFPPVCSRAGKADPADCVRWSGWRGRDARRRLDRGPGAPLPIAAHAAEGYRFDQWVAVEGTPAIADTKAATTTVTLSAAASIRAVFIRIENGPPAR